MLMHVSRDSTTENVKYIHGELIFRGAAGDRRRPSTSCGAVGIDETARETANPLGTRAQRATPAAPLGIREKLIGQVRGDDLCERGCRLLGCAVPQ